MSAEDNKAITRRINEEVWTNGNLDVIEDVIADDYIHTVVGVLPAASRGCCSPAFCQDANCPGPSPVPAFRNNARR